MTTLEKKDLTVEIEIPKQQIPETSKLREAIFDFSYALPFSAYKGRNLRVLVATDCWEKLLASAAEDPTDTETHKEIVICGITFERMP